MNSAGSFGFQGVPSMSNEPPAVYEMCEWKDTVGNFWFFGGEDHSGQAYSDLWKYSPSLNEWTWIKGTATTGYTGYYGTQGVPSPLTNPPSRLYGTTCWADNQNNLWLFGGWGFCDLWKYSISTNEWTWMKGPSTNGLNTGVYGTQGQPDTANYPRDRCESAVSWKDNNGDFWLYGGLAYGGGCLNDLWRFNVATNTWTWMNGSPFTGFPPTYGTQGVEDPANTPGGRYVYSHWKDFYGNLWLFSGTIGANNYYNDLWRYNPLTNKWAWIDGPNVRNATGSYGTKCVLSPTNIPSSRYEDRASWTDKDGNFYLFGGGNIGYTTLWNDLWKYCVSNNEWAYISGDTTINSAGSWGTRGVSSPTNRPAARAGSVGWYNYDASGGHLYMFGGWVATGLNQFNDLWRFDLDSTCAVCAPGHPVAHFSSSDTTFCSETGGCIDFFDQSTNNPTNWQWFFNGAYPDTSSLQNPGNICYLSPGTYSVMLVATNSGGSDTITVNPSIIVTSPPPPPTIYPLGDTLLSSYGSSYQWYLNGFPITGATDSVYIATQSGTYAVRISDNLGCTSISNGVPITITSVIEFAHSAATLLVYPNPAKNFIHLVFKSNNGMFFSQIQLFNVFGEELYSEEMKLKPDSEKEINISSLASGVYLVKTSDGEFSSMARFVKE